jgi:hypothetical protein
MKPSPLIHTQEQVSSPVEIMPTGLEEIRYHRHLFHREVNSIFLTERGLCRVWYHLYLIRHQDRPIGYGLVPTSRCAWDNIASRRSHDRAGFLPGGRQLLGVVKR